MTIEEWRAEATRRFGEDWQAWRFVCPVCGHVQTVAEFVAAGAEPSAAYQECIGRYRPRTERRDAFGPANGVERPCNYAAFGLFQLGPVKVEGVRYGVFAFAE